MGGGCQQGRLVLAGEVSVSRGGQCQQGRLVLAGEVGVSRGGWCQQGRLVLAEEVGVSRGGWCQQGRLMLAGQVSVSRGGWCQQGGWVGVSRGDWLQPQGRGILCWLVVATQSVLVKVHYVSEFCSILRGVLKCFYQDRAKIKIFSILGTTHKDEFE